MKSTTIPIQATAASILLFTSVAASAATIFEADLNNVNINTNNNSPSGTNTLSGSTGALVFTNTNGGSNASGIVSADNVNTLLGLGRSLVTTDTVTFNLGISGYVGNINANGIEFGLSPNGTGFRPDGNLIFQIDDNGGASGLAIGNIAGLGINAAGFGIAEGSLANGFTASLVADQFGYTFTISDIIQSGAGNEGNTELSFSEAFTGTQFVDNFGEGNFYLNLQKTTAPITTTISQFSIDVVSVPEPSQTTLLGLGLIGLLAKRRRRA